MKRSTRGGVVAQNAPCSRALGSRQHCLPNGSTAFPFSYVNGAYGPLMGLLCPPTPTAGRRPPRQARGGGGGGRGPQGGAPGDQTSGRTGKRP